LRPHILRRTKDDVLKALPARHEVLVPIALAAAQVEMYRLILTKNYDLLHSTGGGEGAVSATAVVGAPAASAKTPGKASLTNLLMELRKVVQHPYLITGAEESLVRRAVLDSVVQRRDGSGGDAVSHEVPPMGEVRGAPVATLSDAEAFKLFVDVSGKFKFLRTFLPRLAARGHRVLLFSGTANRL
jgi:SNF2 family DNA or RNA helicase